MCPDLRILHLFDKLSNTQDENTNVFLNLLSFFSVFIYFRLPCHVMFKLSVSFWVLFVGQIWSFLSIVLPENFRIYILNFFDRSLNLKRKSRLCYNLYYGRKDVYLCHGRTNKFALFKLFMFTKCIPSNIQAVTFSLSHISDNC